MRKLFQNKLRRQNRFLKNKKTVGFTLVEVVIASSILLIFLIALTSAYTIYLRTAFSSVRKVQATLLAEEGLEVSKLFRDTSWTSMIATIPTGSDRYLSYSNGWSSNTTNTFVNNIFERKIRFETISRDSSSNIVTSGGTVDHNGRKVTVTVSWLNYGATSTKSISTYITNLFAN